MPNSLWIPAGITTRPTAVDGAAPATSATRELTVADDFLFNQDLVLAQPSPAQ
ncbi:MAG: hypothetical protein P8Y92_00030 [Halioglobus sp.]|jgi:hypothetical protein